jgi:hypothetical protein
VSVIESFEITMELRLDLWSHVNAEEKGKEKKPCKEYGQTC